MTWDACSKHVGGAETAALDAHVENASFHLKAGQEEQGRVSLAVDLAKAFECVQLAVVWPWAMYFRLPQRVLRVLCGYFAQDTRPGFEEEGTSEQWQTVTAIQLGAKWSFFCNDRWFFSCIQKRMRASVGYPKRHYKRAELGELVSRAKDVGIEYS